jgi:hypothetical protein
MSLLLVPRESPAPRSAAGRATPLEVDPSEPPKSGHRHQSASRPPRGYLVIPDAYSLRWFVRGDKADQKLEVVVEVPPPGIGCYFLEGDATTDKP